MLKQSKYSCPGHQAREVCCVVCSGGEVSVRYRREQDYFDMHLLYFHTKYHMIAQSSS